MLNIIDRRIWTTIVAGALLAATALPALAVEQSVTATVTPQLIALSIDDGNVNYGFLGADANQDTVTLGDPQVVSNDGNVLQDFDIRGQNSTPDNWTLAATAASEAYRHEFTTTGTFGTALTTTIQTLDTGVAVNGTTTLDLKITTPTSTSATVQQFVNVTVVATAN